MNDEITVNESISKEPAKKTSRLFYIDLLKALAAFAVVTLHTGVWNTNFMASGSIGTYVQYFFRLVTEPVPVFMLVNGYLIMGKKFDLKKHLIKTLKIFAIFVVWAVILNVYGYFIFEKNMNLTGCLNTILRTQIGQRYSGVLWFLQDLILVYLAFPLFKLAYDCNFKIYRYILAVLLISNFGINIVCMILDCLKCQVNINMLTSAKSFIEHYRLNMANTMYLIYFLMGGYLTKHPEIVKSYKCIIAGIVGWIFAFVYGVAYSKASGNFLGPDYNYSQLPLMLFVLALFGILMRLRVNNRAVKAVVTNISTNSMGIYLIHIIAMCEVTRDINITDFNFISRLLIALAVFLISWAASALLRAIPYVNKIVKM